MLVVSVPWLVKSDFFSLLTARSSSCRTLFDREVLRLSSTSSSALSRLTVSGSFDFFV